jgi:FMN-dependent NADH-azoreductase
MIHVACTALTKRIKAGHTNRAGNTFHRGAVDVTSDCIKAIIEYIGVGETHVVTVDGVPRFEIEIRAVTSGRREHGPE